MHFGLTQDQIDFINRTIEGTLLPEQKVKIYIFGSRARGDFSRYSDIDLLIEAMPTYKSAQKDQLATLFQESDLPYVVDLVFAEELESSYRDEIFKDRKPIDFRRNKICHET